MLFSDYLRLFKAVGERVDRDLVDTCFGGLENLCSNFTVGAFAIRPDRDMRQFDGSIV